MDTSTLTALGAGAYAAGYRSLTAAALAWLTLTTAILVHELGHVAVARVVGLPCRGVVVGMPVPWARREVRLAVVGVAVSLYVVPLRGGAWIACDGAAPWRQSAVLLGGPAASMVIALACLTAAHAVPGVGHTVLVVTGLVNAVSAIVNLVPVSGFDGARLWRVLRGTAVAARRVA